MSSFVRRHPIARFPFLSVLLITAGQAAENSIDYNRDIRPILSENCFSCHGFDEKARKAKLRLDLPESAYAPIEGRVPIRKGDPTGSEVWKRLISTDPDEVMPPPKSHLVITGDQREKLKKWIEEGAEYAGHWAFIPPQKPAVPGNAAPELAIDAFVTKRLEKEKLAPGAEADPAMLLRRVALDLTGLPPSADEVTTFLADTSPQAFEKQVDRLLASPHFGERIALVWMDAARYADTNGFSIDGGRHMWLWRDYVINAFNSNKPYDQFLVEQLAGDLLPNPTEEQRIATGFQRNNMVTHEGGTIPEENLVNYNADRVKTLGESILGLTLGCAQCHDHKFDPISMQDYYSLYAYFNTLGDQGLDGNAGVNPGPQIKAQTVLKTDEEPALRQRISQLEAQLQNPAATEVAAWESVQREALAIRGRDLQLHPVKLLKISTPNRGAGFTVEEEKFAIISQPAGFAAFDVSMQLPKLEKPITGLRVVMHPDPKAPNAGWGYGGGKDAKKSFVLTNISISAGAVPSDQINLYRPEHLARVTANTWEEQNRPEGTLNTLSSEGWAPEITHEGPVHLTVSFSQPLEPAEAQFLTAQLNFARGGNLMAKRMEFFLTTGNDDDTDLPADVLATVQLEADKRTAVQQQRLLAYFAAHAPQTRRSRVELANLKERIDVLTKKFPVMVMNTAAKPRETFVLNRGNYSDPREKVSMGTPKSLPPLPEGAAEGRLGLAQWLTMRNHPLTARVAVNQFWQMLFGVGIVKSSADFGSQGEWPSHPELLDWLAVDFMENRWDVKRLLRSIVLSKTYRQSSSATPAQLEKDPENRLLARGPRFRLSAELIRDAALKSSGLLVPRLGGPSVNPYTPGDPWREISHYGSTPATAQTFVQDHGEKLYRRSLYTFWKRTTPPPNMVAFDAPNREVCVVSRPNTNTPLQALVLLNDVQFVEASRAFAQRILAQPGDDRAKMDWAFLNGLSRRSSAAEMTLLLASLAKERTHFTAKPEAAQALLSAGESLRDISLSGPEHAAWSQIAARILNLSEAVTRN